jgi:apolipoprotein N-acyltransferase
MWMFALFTWSSKSLPGPHFSAAAAGYPLTESFLLLQLARPLGLDALNFMVAMIAAAAAVVVHVQQRVWRRLAWLQVAAVVLVLSFCSWLTRPRHAEAEGARSLRVAIITEQDDFTSDRYEDGAAITQRIAAAAAIVPPVEVIMLPEEISLTSIFWFEEESDDFLARVFGEREVLLLHTRNDHYPHDEDPDAPEMKKLAYESTTQGIIGRYKKQMLMPLGEYAPSFARMFYAVIGDPDIEAHLEDVDQVALERRMPEAVAFRGMRFGGLMCSDMLSPVLYRHLAREERADVLVNLSNQFWFHGSPRLHHKSLQMARVHAVRNRLPLLVANNMAPSYAFDANGRLLAESAWGESGVMVVEAPVSPPTADNVQHSTANIQRSILTWPRERGGGWGYTRPEPRTPNPEP